MAMDIELDIKCRKGGVWINQPQYGVKDSKLNDLQTGLVSISLQKQESGTCPERQQRQGGTGTTEGFLTVKGVRSRESYTNEWTNEATPAGIKRSSAAIY